MRKVGVLLTLVLLAGCGEREREPLVVPVFAGFTEDRHQQHDKLIVELVAAFNADKARWAGATPTQAARIPPLDAALIKSWMIQESGGGGQASQLAWKIDPTQVNHPRDWDDAKLLVGLSKPAERNTADVRTNLEASIKFLARKGFGRAATPPRDREKAYFDGWWEALRRYNGRTDRTVNGEQYSINYAARILERAEDPDEHIKIELPRPLETKPPKKAASQG